MTKKFRWGLIILVSMYLGYMSLMICRNTIVVASPLMIADESLGMDKAMYGQLMAFQSAGGVFGKAISGFAVDRWGGRAIFLLVVMLTSGAAASFALVSHFKLMIGLNFSGQAAKSGGWPAMAALIRDWYPSSQHGRVWGVISTSSRVGVMTATLALGQLLVWKVHWRHLFYVSAGVGLLMMTLGYFFLKSKPEEVGLSLDEERGDEAASGTRHPLDEETTQGAALVFLQSPRVWLMALSMSLTTILLDFLNFIPLYLNESLGLEPGVAGKTTTVFPAGCFVAVLAAGFLYDKLSKKQRVVAIGGALACGILCLASLWGLPLMSLHPDQAFYVAATAIFFFGLAVAPAYYLPMSVFSISFGGPFCGFLICLLDMFGYAGAFFFNYYGGSLVQELGWNVFLGGLMAVTAVATVCLSSFLYLDAVRDPD